MGKRQRFSKEFKLEAVRLLEMGQKSGAQLPLNSAVCFREAVDQVADALAESVEGAFGGFSEQGLELREGPLGARCGSPGPCPHPTLPFSAGP